VRAVLRSMRHNLRQSDRWLWDREYTQLNAIPSSARSLPSKALQLFAEILKFETLESVLDAGCGPGRNAVYFARKGCNVTAVDFCHSALVRTSAAVAASGVSDRVSIVSADLNQPFPFLDAQFDLVVDSYLSCHFLDDKVIAAYWNEMARVVRPDGFVFSSVFTTDDQYYQYSLRETCGELPFVTDPANGITKRLYTDEEFKNVIRTSFDILHFVRFEFSDTVLGQAYMRQLFVVMATPILPTSSASQSEEVN
jgi:SAM-dependent methyltransferase